MMLMMYEQTNWKVAKQIQADVKGLLIELSNLSAWNDELMSMKDHDQVMFRELSAQVKEYTHKYDQAKRSCGSSMVRGIKLFALRRRMLMANI